MLRELGIALIFFGLITLINLYDTYSKLSETSRTLERYGYGSEVSTGILPILTWIGMALTEFVLGLVLYNLEDREPQTQRETFTREKTIPKKSLSKKTGQKIFAVSIFVFLIVYFWQIMGTLNSPTHSPTIDYFMTFGMPVLIASLVSIVVGIVTYLIVKLS